tara:strand:- start:9 stop:548 length:540 start_codon:yes stop_codon:yes gene_type:complete
MGILKNSETVTARIKKRVTFGKEYHQNHIKSVKDFDGMCEESKSWYTFVDLVFKLGVYPQLAWNRVPPKHSDFVWGCILDLLDIYMYKGRCISMPMGNPHSFYIGKRYYAYVDELALWVRDQIDFMQEKKKNLETIMGGWLTFDDAVDVALNVVDFALRDVDSKKDDEMWDNIKENICA